MVRMAAFVRRKLKKQTKTASLQLLLIVLSVVVINWTHTKGSLIG